MDFKEIIKRHLDKMAEQDFAFAERYKDEKKSLKECINYITSQARKQAKGGGAYVEDAVVFGWAVHYYQEDDIKVDKPKGEVKVGYMDNTSLKAKTISRTKAIVKDKRDNKCKELDLFGEFV